MKIYQKILADFEELYLGYAIYRNYCIQLYRIYRGHAYFNERTFIFIHVRIILSSFGMHGF